MAKLEKFVVEVMDVRGSPEDVDIAINVITDAGAHRGRRTVPRNDLIPFFFTVAQMIHEELIRYEKEKEAGKPPAGSDVQAGGPVDTPIVIPGFIKSKDDRPGHGDERPELTVQRPGGSEG